MNNNTLLNSQPLMFPLLGRDSVELSQTAVITRNVAFRTDCNVESTESDTSLSKGRPYSTCEITREQHAVLMVWCDDSQFIDWMQVSKGACFVNVMLESEGCIELYLQDCITLFNGQDPRITLFDICSFVRVQGELALFEQPQHSAPF